MTAQLAIPNDISRFAVHESGHAVVAFAVGLKATAIKQAGPDRRHWTTCVPMDPYDMAPWKLHNVKVAGAEAVILWNQRHDTEHDPGFGKSNDPMCDARDEQALLDYLEALGVGLIKRKEVQEAARANARKVLEDSWPLVEALATLAEKASRASKIVSEDEIKSLIDKFDTDAT